MTGAVCDLPLPERADWHATTWGQDDYTAVVFDEELLHGWSPSFVRVVIKEILKMEKPWYIRLFDWAKRRRWWLLGLPVVLGGLWRALRWVWGPGPDREPAAPRVDTRRVEAERERIRAHAEGERERVNERADNLVDAIRERLGDE